MKNGKMICSTTNNLFKIVVTTSKEEILQLVAIRDAKSNPLVLNFFINDPIIKYCYHFIFCRKPYLNYKIDD